MKISQNGSTHTERYYLGGGMYERDYHNGSWRNICYIGSPTGLIAINIEDETTNENQLVYTYTDYQGTILALAEEGGGILEEFSYDAWGNRRDANTWENIYTHTQTTYAYADPGALWGNFYRGYTGHEHLDVFGIINMNGRLYDPLVARMLSPDNFVQNSTYTQNYNRYSYVYNNPLLYEDPSGEFIVTSMIIGAVIGAYLGGSVANNSFNPGQWDWSSSSTWIGIGIGGLAGAFGGKYVATSIKAGKTNAILSQTYSGGLNTLYNYDSNNSIVATLGYFASGFLAASMGILSSEYVNLGASKLNAALAGGSMNSIVAGFNGEFNDFYGFAQSFIGGAVVGYSSTAFYVKKANIKATKFLFKNNKAANYLFERGLLNIATTFAYTDEESYRKMKPSAKFGAPFFSAVVGEGMRLGFFADNPSGKLINVLKYTTSFSIEYAFTSFDKTNYEYFADAKNNKWHKKSAIIGWKSVWYGLNKF